MKWITKTVLLFIISLFIIVYLLFNMYQRSRADKTSTSEEYLRQISVLSTRKRVAGSKVVSENPVVTDNNEVQFNILDFIIKLFSLNK